MTAENNWVLGIHCATLTNKFGHAEVSLSDAGQYRMDMDWGGEDDEPPYKWSFHSHTCVRGNGVAWDINEGMIAAATALETIDTKVRRYGFLSGFSARNDDEEAEMRSIREYLAENGVNTGWSETPREPAVDLSIFKRTP